MEFNDGLLRLSAQKALLFYLFPKVRMISLDIKDGILDMLFAVTEALTEDEKDMAYTISAQIEGDFVEIKRADVEFVIGNDPIDDLPQLRLLILAQFK